MSIRYGPTLKYTKSMYQTILSLVNDYKTCQFKLSNDTSYDVIKVDNLIRERVKDYLSIHDKNFYIQSSYINNLAGKHRLTKVVPSINSMMHELSYFPDRSGAIYNFRSINNLNDISDTINQSEIPFGYGKNKLFLLENSCQRSKINELSWDNMVKVYEGIDQSSKIGVCLNMFQLYNSGFCQFENINQCERMLQEVENKLGLINLIHISDSLIENNTTESYNNVINVRKNNYNLIGEGYIWNSKLEIFSEFLDLINNSYQIDLISESQNSKQDCKLISQLLK